MDYDSKSSGGIGFVIEFPEHIGLPEFSKLVGRYVKANIERLELEAIVQGMNEILRMKDEGLVSPKDVGMIIFRTDRFSLSDHERTNHFRIDGWRKNKWKNFEGKAIKNHDLLDEIDKTRKKIMEQLGCQVKIVYTRRKYNKKADKLSKKAKKSPTELARIAQHGLKIGRRKFSGEEIDYKKLSSGSELIISIYFKQPVGDQWEIRAEVCEGKFKGQIVTISVNSHLEMALHRSHKYLIKIQKVLRHHLEISSDLTEIELKPS